MHQLFTHINATHYIPALPTIYAYTNAFNVHVRICIYIYIYTYGYTGMLHNIQYAIMYPHM